MHNPYAHNAGPGPTTPEGQRAQDYELAIGKNAGYYLPKFERFDEGGSRLGWHWPAFFVTTPWFLYRKMWGWGMGNLAWFWGMLTLVLPFLLAIALAAREKGGGDGLLIGVCVVVGLLMALPWFLLPMFANALYWKHANKVIRNMPTTIAQNPDKRAARIERNGGTGAGGMIAVLAGGAFFGVFVVGIIAAISIPAYQDYTLRAQVQQGLNLAAGAKAVVTEYYSQNREWPADSATAGFSVASGEYVQSVEIEGGSVVIVFGGKAHQNLDGKTVILLPVLTADDELHWICAGGPEPADISERAPGPSGSDVPNKYLPSQCRPAAGT
ncbi:MAG TPA: pilin [Steroidobacteraceae bacterium]|nr:pilin [Steroidobacteraceae bacterium]